VTLSNTVVVGLEVAVGLEVPIDVSLKNVVTLENTVVVGLEVAVVLDVAVCVTTFVRNEVVLEVPLVTKALGHSNVHLSVSISW
jgi:hypothetical protein